MVIRQLDGTEDRPSRMPVLYVSHLVAGVVLEACDEKGLRGYLSQNNLIINRPDAKSRQGYFPLCTIRQKRDKEGYARYHVWTVGESNPQEIAKMKRFDLVVGRKVSESSADGQHEVDVIQHASLDEALSEVVTNLSDARIIHFSNFI